jgi:predicted alpha/beta-hydrolase family hydrolase
VRTLVGIAAVVAVGAVGLSLGRGARAEEPAAKVEVVKVSTPRGATFEASLHTPAMANGTAVVLAPGQGYHRELPILKRSAEALAAAGFTALRFDWAYTAAKGNASEDLSAEREDLEAAIARARALPGVTKVVVGGKSLGSVVAFSRALEKSDDLAGLLLLTFPLHEPGGRPRPGVERFGEAAVPTLVVQGDRDPLGSLMALYDVASQAKHAPRVVVVPGDHSYAEKPRGTDDPNGRENVEAAVAAVVLWSRRFAAP